MRPAQAAVNRYVQRFCDGFAWGLGLGVSIGLVLLIGVPLAVWMVVP